MRKAKRFQKVRRVLVIYRLVGLNTAVDPAVCDHLLAVHWLDPLHVRNRATIGAGAFPDLRRDAIHPSPGYVFLMASGIPDDEVARPGALRHLPVVYRAACSDPGSQFGDVLGLLIYLKYVDLNQSALQVQTSALRDVISPRGRRQRSPQPATSDYGDRNRVLLEPPTARTGDPMRQIPVVLFPRSSPWQLPRNESAAASGELKRSDPSGDAAIAEAAIPDGRDQARVRW